MPRSRTARRRRILSRTFALQEARLRLAEIGADYAVFRNGKLTVGPVLLGAEDVRDIRSTVASAAVSDRRELSTSDRGVPRWAAARCYPRCAPGSLRRFFLP